MSHLGYHSVRNLFRVDPETGQVAVDPTAEHLHGIRVFAEDKVDGMNIGIRYRAGSGRFEFIGKEPGSQIPSGLLSKLLEITYDNPRGWKDNFSSREGEDVIVYGEGIGYSINGNRHGFAEGVFDFIAFDVYDVTRGIFYDSKWSRKMLDDMNIPTSDIIVDCFRLTPEVEDFYTQEGNGPLTRVVETTVDGIVFSPLKSFAGPKEVDSEGVIIRPMIPLRTNNNERVIWKHKPSEIAKAVQKFEKKDAGKK